MIETSRSASPFGVRLRGCRRRAGLSQLALATRAGTTGRHLSFLETGRSRPGEELVLRLGRALDLPLRERNALLVAAGFSARYREARLDDPSLAPISNVVDRVLAQHEPFPAWAFARGLRPMVANAAGERLFPGLTAMSPTAIVDTWFGPGPFREMVENWREVSAAGLDSLRRDAAAAADPDIDRLVQRAESLLAGIGDPPIDSSFPVVCPRFRVGGQLVRTVSAVLRFDTAVDVTTSELRVELMFPADEPSAAFFRGLALPSPGIEPARAPR